MEVYGLLNPPQGSIQAVYLLCQYLARQCRPGLLKYDLAISKPPWIVAHRETLWLVTTFKGGTPPDKLSRQALSMNNHLGIHTWA
jgi:hypothetical protein